MLEHIYASLFSLQTLLNLVSLTFRPAQSRMLQGTIDEKEMLYFPVLA
jgi:hypothetical protein